jgi:hypothetical protein
MRQVNLMICLALAALAQQGPIDLNFRQQGPINLNFRENGPGGEPIAWRSIRESGYSTATTEDCRMPNSRCAVLRYEGRSDPRDFGWLMQTFDATALRGKQVRYRAWLRIDDSSDARAQLFVRVDRPNHAIGFHDYSHDRPMRSRDWAMREIAGRIDRDAVTITIGLMLGGRGSAYLADLEFASLENSR